MEAGMRLVILAVAVVAVAALAMLGEEPDACRYAENWRQPGVCDR